MPFVKARLIGRQPKEIEVKDTVTVKELKTLLENAFELSSLTMVYRGKPLTDESRILRFTDGETLLVTMAPSRPIHSTNEEWTDPDADITFRLDPSAPAWKKWVYHVLSDRLKFPNIVLYWLFSIRPLYYGLFILWMILSPIAARYDLGPLYILCTIFLLIVVNLGVRREGELSGYSLFNENLQSLPGQLRAEQLDQQIRHGQM